MRRPRSFDRRSRSPFRVASAAAVLVVALAFGVVSQLAQAADPLLIPPAAGRLLVARAGLPDPNFYQTVVLLLDYDAEQGAVGVVLNRRSERAVGEVASPAAGLADRSDWLYLGGPVALENLIVLVAQAEAPPDSTTVLPGVAVVRGGPELDELLAGDPPAPSVRFYAGYAGWAAGQLEDEIARGVWHLLPGDARWVFDERPEQTWRRLVEIVFGPRA